MNVRAPSEHTFNDKQYELELQIFHSVADVSLNRYVAVLSFLFEAGEASPFLEGLVSNTTTTMSNLTATYTDYYAYHGSDTFPACTEVYNWFISAEVKTAS